MTPGGAGRRARAAYASMLALVAVAQFSVAAAGVFLALTILGWLAVVIAGRERVPAAAPVWPLAAFALLSLVSVVFSIDPVESLVDQKELLMLLLVPAVHRLARGRRAMTTLGGILTAGAVAGGGGLGPD